MSASDSAEITDDQLGAERVLAHFREQMLAGALRPGQRLAGERELAASLSVSRPVLREALRALAMIGLIEIRQGKGAWMRRADIGVLSDMITASLANEPDAIDDAMQARVAIECQAIRLACVRAGNADLDRIGRSLSEFALTLPDPERGGATDFEFHLAVVEASRSPALITLYRSIAGLLRISHVERRRQTIAVPGIVDTLVAAHREVFLSIVSRDPDAADRNLREHFAIGDELRRKSYIASVSSLAAHTQEASTREN